jgi:hypothetical protein
MTALDIAILLPLIPALAVLITWWLPWERWTGWRRLPKLLLGPYLLYCAFGAWHFHFQWWVAAVTFIVGTVICMLSVKQALNRRRVRHKSDDLLELQGPHGWLRIFCKVIDKARSPVASQGYQHLRYAVATPGFSGEGDGFVTEDELRIFCRGLVQLADGGDYEPKLMLSATGGLAVVLRCGPGQDQISIEGQIVSMRQRTANPLDGHYTSATQFGFWVFRHFLSRVAEVRWVKHFNN